ncbi:MAG: hypothetical protein DRN96_07705 [Thermoproteota archaeon]|nr:MAG: hypothetical protein DRN96_07705 [Candidatus Korarchaeota archaeon]
MEDLDRVEEEIRRRHADWSFIERQKPRVKWALIYYIRTGDIRTAQKLAGLSIEEFNELRLKAKIPIVHLEDVISQ